MKRLALLLVAATALLTACEVDFSPNAEWKEVPVVYCLLDQDDDTTWARVEKCFLGEGSIYSYGQISDSFNYPQGSIRVTLMEYDREVLNDSIDFIYTTRDRADGNFAATDQPIYYTTHPLQTRYTYSLQVRRTSDDSLLASTDPIQLLILEEDQLVTKPTNNDRFRFLGRAGSSDPTCQIEWHTLYGGRIYKPIVRFYYIENGDTLYVDLPCMDVTASPTATLATTYYSRSAFLSSLQEALKDDPNPKIYPALVDIYITAADENLNVYLNSANSGTSLTQTSNTYTNIHGGAGIFAARRTHLFRRAGADNSLNPPDGLHYMIKQLGLGFQ